MLPHLKITASTLSWWPSLVESSPCPFTLSPRDCTLSNTSKIDFAILQLQFAIHFSWSVQEAMKWPTLILKLELGFTESGCSVFRIFAKCPSQTRAISNTNACIFIIGWSSNYWHFRGNGFLLLTKNAVMKRWQKFGQGPPPPLIWTKSKRTAAFFDVFP